MGLQNTTDKSDSLRNLVLRIAKLELTADELTRFRSDFSAEFLFDMAYAFAEERSDHADYEFSFSLKELEDDFCADLHVEGGCYQLCTRVKEYVVIDSDVW